ncbi:BnaA09g28470D [Brassica napus]|uniref:BnaA09g28470D protein n=1 Tax=Brassica napus TaxID=3708 RepID=A0A078HZF1_BRANA|nr:BnaA09g28470D [Brassica napus]
MVFRGEMTTTTRPERPKTLHNFTLPSLKWGSQRHLTCTKIESTSSGSGSGDPRLRRRSPPLRFSDSSVAIPASGESEHQEGIEEFRVKIMSDLKTVRDKITQSMYALGERDEEQRRTDGSGSGQEEKEVSPVKPWNLRKRRAACKEPAEGRIVNPSPPPCGAVEAETAAKEMMVRPKFFVKLSKKEIEEDFMAVVGHRPPRRPKKRPRTVQKKLDSLHPAFYLTEVTLDDYKVEETKV